MLIILLLINFITASLTHHMVTNVEIKQTEEQSHNSLALLSVAITNAVITENIPLLNTIMKQSLEYIPNIVAISIKNKNGKLLGNFSQEHVINSSDVRNYSHPIGNKNERLGTINVSWNIATVKQKINRHVARVQLFTTIIFIVLTGLTVILIHCVNAYLIRRIICYLTALSENKQLPPLKKIFFSNRELEFLTISANNLSNIIQQHIQRECELLKMCEKLQIAHDKAVSDNQAKSDYLATMSHEIRIPINSMLGILSLLKNTVLDKKQLQLVNTGHDSGELLLAIINDVLDFSKLEANKLQLKHTNFNLHRLLTTSVELLKPLADQKMLTLIIFLEHDLPCYAKGDPGRLRQVLINLINNAIKFTSTGKITIKASTTCLGNENFTLHCSVQDTGIGIAKDFQASLFEKFTMADQSHSRNYEGTGLGLNICKHLVTLMQGSINFNSELGKGSTFTFTSVLETANEYKCENETTLNEIQRLPAANTRILLAEDNTANQMVIKNILEYTGLQVDIVANGRDAIEAVRNFPYDIVLMDVSMPDMDGINATREIRQLSGQVGKLPIIALTAHSLSGDRERFIQAGMNDYLTKPIDRTATLHCIARWTTKTISTKKLQNNHTLSHTDTFPANTNNRYTDPFVDTSVLQQLAYDTSPEIVPELLTLYINDARKRIKKIQGAITKSDFKILEFESHALGSSAVAHGNFKLHTLAYKIEQLCQRGDYAQVLTHATSLPILANKSFRSIEKYLSDMEMPRESIELG